MTKELQTALGKTKLIYVYVVPQLSFTHLVSVHGHTIFSVYFLIKVDTSWEILKECITILEYLINMQDVIIKQVGEFSETDKGAGCNKA